jgi:hypothetical protein
VRLAVVGHRDRHLLAGLQAVRQLHDDPVVGRRELDAASLDGHGVEDEVARVERQGVAAGAADERRKNNGTGDRRRR